MDKALQRRRMVEHELRLGAGPAREFEVVYQPQYDLATEKQCGSEALVRRQHPVHGKIAPDKISHFVAEDTGPDRSLGEWVLRRACTPTQPNGRFVDRRRQPVARAIPRRRHCRDRRRGS